MVNLNIGINISHADLKHSKGHIMQSMSCVTSLHEQMETYTRKTSIATKSWAMPGYPELITILISYSRNMINRDTQACIFFTGHL